MQKRLIMSSLDYKYSLDFRIKPTTMKKKSKQPQAGIKSKNISTQGVNSAYAKSLGNCG